MAQYSDLTNNGGEITNQTTGKVYPNPQELAGDLGIAPHQIDWSQITAGGGQGNTGTTTANPITSFNSAVMGKLKEYQGLTSADLIKRQSAILKKLYAGQGAVTPEEQRVLSPSQQSAVRGGQASALRPELEATQGQLIDRKEAQKRFLETVGVARDIGKDMEDLKTQQADKAMEGFKMLAASGQSLDQSSINQVAELTGYDPSALTSYYGVLQEKANYDKQIQDLDLALKRKGLAPDTYAPTDAQKVWNAMSQTEQGKYDGFGDWYARIYKDRDVGGGNVVITKDYLKSKFTDATLLNSAIEQMLGMKAGDATDEILKEEAKKAGFTAGGFLGIGVGAKGLEDYKENLKEQYLDYFMGLIEQYREQGMSDDKILKEMQ